MKRMTIPQVGLMALGVYAALVLDFGGSTNCKNSAVSKNPTNNPTPASAVVDFHG